MRGVVNILIVNLLQNSLVIGSVVAAYIDCVEFVLFKEFLLLTSSLETQ